MANPIAIVTGAGGEMARLLIPELASRGYDVVGVDLVALPSEVASQCTDTAEASILDTQRMQSLIGRYRPEQMYHLAAMLSAKAEREPDLAHRVNVDGTLELFRICRETGAASGRPVRFLFPSSIAVYGLPDRAAKDAQGAVRETEWTDPTGMYGCNKRYCELFGGLLARRQGTERLDFRSIRFPGLISAETLPTSGTTDYAPAMVHAAARGENYTCFVDEATRLPFMTMPDAIAALVGLAHADENALSTRVYNIRGFSASVTELRDALVERFPQLVVEFEVDPVRQRLADSWPADVDDRLARQDWGLAPRHGLTESLDDYLLPVLAQRYGSEVG